MKRREFLHLASNSIPLTLALSSGAIAAEANKPLASQPEPKVFFFDDGRHAAGLYQFEPPLTPSDHVYTVDQLAASGVDTYIYCANVEGGTAVYASQVSQKWGETVKDWTHYVWYRAARCLQQLIADGHDPLKLLCDRCHALGIWMIPSANVTLAGGDRATYGGQGRKSDFVYDNPQFQVGEDPDDRAKQVSPLRFSFLHSAVREERFRVFEELLTRYETDGVELILSEMVPMCRFRDVPQLKPVLTAWLARLREVASKAERAQQRRKRIVVRVPAHAACWEPIGCDVRRWVSDKLVDGLICVTSDEEHMNQDLDLSEAVRMTRGTQCRVLASFCNTLSRQMIRYATPEMIWAAAANAYAQGADGFGLGDAHWTPSGWPWTEKEYQTLRVLGHADLLATVDKCYHLRSKTNDKDPESWLPGSEKPLPRALKLGEPIELALRVSDDLKKYGPLGRVKKACLRLRFTNLVPSMDKVRVEWNGQLLPESLMEKIDFTYRLWSGGAISPYGYIYEFTLPQQHYPISGINSIKVALVQRDPKLKLPLELRDIDCNVEYRLHRHFETNPVEY